MRFFNSGCPADQLHKVAGRVEVERTHSKEPQKMTQQDSNQGDEAKSYSIQPKRVADKDLPQIPSAEVQQNDGQDGKKLFIVVNDIVLDCTTYINSHPGGRQIIQGFAGENCGWQWWRFHNRKIWEDVASHLRVGRTQGIDNKHVQPPNFVGLRPFGYQDD